MDGGRTPAVAERFDVIIVGAGLSGVGTAVRLQQRFPPHARTGIAARVP